MGFTRLDELCRQVLSRMDKTELQAAADTGAANGKEAEACEAPASGLREETMAPTGGEEVLSTPKPCPRRADRCVLRQTTRLPQRGRGTHLRAVGDHALSSSVGARSGLNLDRSASRNWDG